MADAGDTDFVPEMKELKDIDVALLPVDGGDLTMTTEAAAEAAAAIRPKIVVPIQYPMNSRAPLLFRKLVQAKVPEVRVEILTAPPGE